MVTNYDLSALNLPVGNHNIHVVGKATNYEDSASSNVVVYTVLDIVISGLQESYQVGDTVENISAVLEGTETPVDYTINGEVETSHEVVEADIETGITVVATHNGVTKTATATVTAAE